MKGIILAGGTGSRLMPLTKITNKHLLPIYDKPMIYYPLETMRNAGVADVMIVSGRGHAGHFLETLGSGYEFGLRLSYMIQEHPGGIAQAIGLCKDFVKTDNCFVILGDNIFEDSLKMDIDEFDFGAKIFLKKVPHPERFGVVQIDGANGKIVSIEEKPKKPKSNLAQTGAYIFDARVWEIIKKLTPSDRGEYEVTHINNSYMRAGYLKYRILNGYWSDAGTFDSMLAAGEWVRKKCKRGRS